MSHLQNKEEPKLCNYCENKSTYSFDIILSSDEVVVLQSCYNHKEIAHLQQENILMRDKWVQKNKFKEYLRSFYA
jgi:hypothetical protein